MPKILNYNVEEVLLEEIEIPYEDGSGNFFIEVKKTKNALRMLTIADKHGRIATAEDVVRESGLSLRQLREKIGQAFSSKKNSS